MSDPQTGQKACRAASEGRGLDALVIGAGVAGLYQLYLLREQGLEVLACDTLPHTFTGFEYDFENTWAELTADRRHALLEEIYRDGSLKLWLAAVPWPRTGAGTSAPPSAYRCTATRTCLPRRRAHRQLGRITGGQTYEQRF